VAITSLTKYESVSNSASIRKMEKAHNPKSKF